MFHPELVSFLKLLGRSPEEVGGWRSYSKATRTLVMRNHDRFPGLFEVDDQEGKVRLTAEGGVLVKWMNHVPK